MAKSTKRGNVRQITKKQVYEHLDYILTMSCCISTIRRLDKDKVVITDISSKGFASLLEGDFDISVYNKHYAMAFRVKKELEGLGFRCVPVEHAPKNAFCNVYSIDTSKLKDKLRIIFRQEKLKQLGF